MQGSNSESWDLTPKSAFLILLSTEFGHSGPSELFLRTTPDLPVLTGSSR